jgi:hypothetical protein
MLSPPLEKGDLGGFPAAYKIPPTTLFQRGVKISHVHWIVIFENISLEALAKPDFTVILNEVKNLKSLKIRDSSRHSE